MELELNAALDEDADVEAAAQTTFAASEPISAPASSRSSTEATESVVWLLAGRPHRAR